MLSYRQLSCFVAVAEELHFSRAADRLGVAQSAVSLQVQQLEQTLGVRLLNRLKRQPITMTDAGQLLYAEAIAALRHLERAERVGQLAARGLNGRVRLGYVASAVTTGLLSEMLGAFRPRHEQVHLDVVAMETPRQLSAIESGDIDVGIVRPRRQYPEGVDAVIVHSEPLMIAMSKDHALARRRMLRCADLRGQTFISPQFKESEGFAELVGRLAVAGGFSETSEYHVNDLITAVSLAAAGYGVVIAPESIKQFNHRGVVFLAISDFREMVHLALAFRRHEAAPAVREFLASAKPAKR